MSLFRIFQWRGFWCVSILFLMLSISKYATASSSWSDVLSSLSSCQTANPTCTCWVEEILTTAGTGYRVWKRCSAGSVVYSTQKTLTTYTQLIDNNSSTAGIPACNGTNATVTIPISTIFYNFPSQYPSIKSVYCTGSSTTASGSVAISSYGAVHPCVLGVVLSSGVNCSSYDVLVSQNEGIVDNCQIDYLSVGSDSYGDFSNVACACIPDRFSVTQYPFLDVFGNTGCKVRNVVGNPVLAQTPVVLTDGVGGSVNTNTATGGVSNGTVTSPTTTTTTTPVDTSAGSQTNTSSTITTVTGGAVTNTSTTTTNISNFSGPVAGSKKYTTTTTTPTGTTTTTTGCIDANGDGLDDGSGIECAPSARTFTAPSVTYDTTLDVPVEKNIVTLLTDYISQNPLVSIVTGTHIQLSNSTCSASFDFHGHPISVDFCPYAWMIDLFGTVFYGICGIRSVFIALGVD